MADAKYSMPDGSYPINTCADVSDAAKLAHHSKTYSFAEVKAHVLRAKKALGCGDEVLPDTWETNDAPGDKERSLSPSSFDSFRNAVLSLELSGNGRTLSGLAVPYGTLAEIRDQRGHYQEQIAPGAFDQWLQSGKPKMLFEHGQDVRTGRTPIGSFERVWSESDGIHVKGELFDNQLVQPLADAARARELAEWSVHFRTAADGSGERWARVKGWNVRTVTQAHLPEISLVNFGAYPTTVSIRSSLDELAVAPDAAGSGDGTSDESARNGDSSSTTQSARIRDRIWRMRKLTIG